MRDHSSYDYAVIRVVPRVDREEFLNVGVIVSCPAKDFLEARIELDESRLLAFDPTLDLDAVRALVLMRQSASRATARGKRAGRRNADPPRRRSLPAWSSASVRAAHALHPGRADKHRRRLQGVSVAFAGRALEEAHGGPGTVRARLRLRELLPRDHRAS